MAITSIGYDGTVDETAWTRLMGKTAGCAYGVLGPTDWKVTAHPTLARGVVIAAGHGWGHGVYDINDATVSLQGADILSGTRWDMVVARRSWTGVGGVTTFQLLSGTSTKALVSRSVSPGVTDEQPLALVQYTGGSTVPTSIIDLRVWPGNGGMYAADLMARDYNTQIGSRLIIGTEDWISIVSSAGIQQWQRQSALQSVQLYGVGGTLVGGSPVAATSSFMIQSGSNIVTSDGAGYGRINFPVSFPNGLVTIILTNGDSSIDRGFTHVITLSVAGNPWNNGTKDGFAYSVAVEDSAGTNRLYMVANLLHRCNWIAIGW
jgi:hypothetical protein